MIALDEKVKVLDDCHKEVDCCRRDFRESEAKRGELQEHITQTGVKVGQDAKEHETYQDDLIRENDDLKQQIRDLKQQMAFKERDWLDKTSQQEDKHERDQKALSDKMERQRQDLTKEL